METGRDGLTRAEKNGIVAKERKRRHTNTLSTPEERTGYADAVATALEQVALAFSGIAQKIREDSEEMLKLAFLPNVYPVDPRSRVRIEVERPAARENAPIAVRVTFNAPRLFDSSRKVTIRLIWRDGAIEVTEDDSLG